MRCRGAIEASSVGAKWLGLRAVPMRLSERSGAFALRNEAVDQMLRCPLWSAGQVSELTSADQSGRLGLRKSSFLEQGPDERYPFVQRGKI